MMQHVATAKSEIAAFATTAESNSIVDTESQAQFGKLLQDQKTPDSVVVKSKTTSPQSPGENASQSPSEDVKNDSSSMVDESNTTKDKSVASGADKASNEATSTSGHDKTTESSKNLVTEEQSNKSNLSDELKDANKKAESQAVLPAIQHDKKWVDESSKIVAEEWVLLIDNLKKLASNSESPISSLKDLGISTIDLELSDKVDKELLEQIAETPFLDQARMSLDGVKLPQGADSKDLVDRYVIAKKSIETTKPIETTKSMDADQGDGVDIGRILATNEQVQMNMSMYVDKALAEALVNVELEGLPKTAVSQEAAKLLLQQPDVMQELIGQLQSASQKSDISEENTLDTATKEDLVLANQQLENVVKVDFTRELDIDLLKTLVVETEVDADNTKFPVELAEVGINKVEPVVESGKLIEQELEIPQIATSNTIKANKADSAVTSSDIKSLLTLSDNKLDKVLENIAQRFFESNNSVAPISPEQIVQQVVTPKNVEIINSIESSSKEFISVLKSGLEEFKNQLSQGREPGIDLKALVAEALTKTADSTSATVTKTPINPEQIANSVSQMLNLAQSMNRTIEERHDQLYSATLRDIAQVQGEQTKQVQLNMVESKFEKAINIAKPEGHQQLAEKVRWMVNTKNLVAEIRLDPAELGSVHVKVAMSGESATINFVVQSQQARDAVDTATPRLREMLAEKGIELGQSSVRKENDGQQEQGEFVGQDRRGNEDSENVEAPEQVLAQQNIINGALGGIDYFV